MTQFTRASAAERISDAAEGALDATMDAIGSSRQFVSDAAGKIGDTARDLGGHAADLARASAASVSDARVAAQRQLGRQAEATLRYVERQPWKSLAIAAFVGAAVAALGVAVFRKPHDGE